MCYLQGRNTPSRTLNTSEKNYAQIEKEALSIVFGVKHFHKYLYGCKLHLLNDHKLLLAILGPKSTIPALAALRMQCCGVDFVGL